MGEPPIDLMSALARKQHVPLGIYEVPFDAVGAGICEAPVGS
jgi:hypothetical protein